MSSLQDPIIRAEPPNLQFFQEMSELLGIPLVGEDAITEADLADAEGELPLVEKWLDLAHNAGYQIYFSDGVVCVWDDEMNEDSEAELYEAQQPYCDYCEREGHTFRSCPKRDDEPDEEDAEEPSERDIVFQQAWDALLALDGAFPEEVPALFALWEKEAGK